MPDYDKIVKLIESKLKSSKESITESSLATILADTDIDNEVREKFIEMVSWMNINDTEPDQNKRFTHYCNMVQMLNAYTEDNKDLIGTFCYASREFYEIFELDTASVLKKMYLYGVSFNVVQTMGNDYRSMQTTAKEFLRSSFLEQRENILNSNIEFSNFILITNILPDCKDIDYNLIQEFNKKNSFLYTFFYIFLILNSTTKIENQKNFFKDFMNFIDALFVPSKMNLPEPFLVDNYMGFIANKIETILMVIKVVQKIAPQEVFQLLQYFDFRISKQFDSLKSKNYTDSMIEFVQKMHVKTKPLLFDQNYVMSMMNFLIRFNEEDIAEFNSVQNNEFTFEKMNDYIRLREITKESEALYNSFIKFKSKFIHLNNKVTIESNWREFYMFIDNNSKSLRSLFNVFGLPTFDLLSKYLVTSALSLERLLIFHENDESVYVKNLFKIYQNLFLNHADGPDLLFSMLTLENLASSLNISGIEIEKIFNIIEKNPSAESLVIMKNSLGLFVSSEYLKMMNVKKQIDFDTLTKRIPIDRMIELISARKAMQGMYYKDIFDDFIVADLTGEPYVPNDAVKAHNANIRNLLNEAGINAEKALDPNREYSEFTYGGVFGKTDVDQLIKALWDDLNMLYKSDLTNHKLIGFIDSFQTTMLKGFNRQSTLTQEDIRTILTKLLNNKSNQLSTLCEKIGNLNLTNISSKEFYGHLQREQKLLNDLLLQPEQSFNYFAKKKFRIVHWDKASPETFNLGTAVGCCLSPKSSQFPAMVQRRMDDSMFFHVVIEEETNRPVSLAWLYFGEAKAPEKGIYVVANFFEIATSCAKDARLLAEIVKNLQSYIAKYTADIGAKGFMMNQLKYGLIPDFKGFPMKSIAFEKLGGYLSYQGNSESYYLSSLCQNIFYEHPLPQPSATQGLVRFQGNSNMASNSNSDSNNLKPGNSNGPVIDLKQ